MRAKAKKPSGQSINLIISCLVSLLVFAFITLLAKGLSVSGDSAVFENLFYYCHDTQTLTLFGEVLPVSPAFLKLARFPRASAEFTLGFFPPMTRELIYKFSGTFAESFGDFISFIIKFITK